MAILKCKMCGGDLEVAQGTTVAECEYCGVKQTVPQADSEKKLNLFNRANRLRIGGEFDKAMGIYESIVAEFPEEAEAYWGLVICTYGIEYVDDPATANKIPTCHRASFESVLNDENYKLALEYADLSAQKVYRDEAKEIERIRTEILSVSSSEAPYDIFICYKESDNGERTVDSVLAQDVYDALTAKGYRVFFARISLEDKLGRQYEPYIFAALNSARVMLAFGTKYEYYHAVWVKNEWSRFLKLMAKDKTKALIPCYKDMDAYDLPEEFKPLQAQDLGKVGATQDLLRGIGKLLPRAETIKETAVAEQLSATAAACDPLLQRAFLFLEDKDWNSAYKYCDKVLDIDPQNARAYLCKLMADMEVCSESGLYDFYNTSTLFDNNSNYKKFIRFADDKSKNKLIDCVNRTYARIEEERVEGTYERAKNAKLKAHNKKDYLDAAALFDSISDYKDSSALANECREAAEVRKNSNILNQATTIAKHNPSTKKNPG